MGYNVVFKNLSGVTTWTSFVSKEKFCEWYNDMAHNELAIVAEGVTDDEATALCSTLSARMAAFAAGLGELNERYS